ncbi:MAG: hypothetical protein ACLVJB_00680 [Christensenellales bacterium]
MATGTPQSGRRCAPAGGESWQTTLTAVLGAFAKEVGALFQMMLSVMPGCAGQPADSYATPSDSLSMMSKAPASRWR